MKSPAADPWKNSTEHEVSVREEQVAKLESQVTELQKLVERLATEKAEAANAQPSSAPNQRPRSHAINPWSQNSAPVQSAEVEVEDEQAEQIAMLQARIEELSKERQSVNKSAVTEDDIAEPLIRQEQKQAERELPKRDKSTAKSGVFSRFGVALSRR